MRWDGQTMKPVDGWEQFNFTGTPASPVRAVFVWLDNDLDEYVALLCQEHVYVVIDNALVDITPVDDLGQEESPGGYGDDFFGTGEHGGPREPPPWRVTAGGTAWTMNNWGEDLLVMSSADGRLLRWKPSTPSTPLEAVPNAPVDCRTFAVTPERYVVVFGFDTLPNGYAWCHQEDIEDWSFATPPSLAGFLPVEPASPCYAAVELKEGILFWTRTHVYFARFDGLPYIFSTELVGEAATPISPQFVVAGADFAMWGGESGFWRYDNGIMQPVQCDVWEYIRKALLTDEAQQYASSIHLSAEGEIWFLLPSVGSMMNDIYAAYDYRNGFWMTGKLDRACGFDVKHVKKPYMSDGTNLWLHESGNAYPGAVELPWAESHVINTKVGRMTIRKALPDVGGNSMNVTLSLIGKKSRASDDEITFGPYFIRADGKVDMRATARDFRLRYDMQESGQESFTIGPVQLYAAKRGGR